MKIIDDNKFLVPSVSSDFIAPLTYVYVRASCLECIHSHGARTTYRLVRGLELQRNRNRDTKSRIK